MIYNILIYIDFYMNLKYLRQCIDELHKCKDETHSTKRMTRSKEQLYLEKCRDFVELLIDSDILYEFADINCCDMDESKDESAIINQYNDYTTILTQYQTDSNAHYTAIFDKYRLDSYDHYSSIINQYHVNSEAYYADLLNQYQVNSESYYTDILNQYQVDNEKYYTEYNVWYEYYIDYLRTLCWEYYENVEKNQVALNQELVIKNRDLLARNKTLQEFETNYNSLLTQNKNTTLLLNSMKSEYKEIYRRLMIMISQYNKIYIEFAKYKKNTDITEKINEINDFRDIQEIPDDYDYIIDTV
jgi:hypothetical protein